MFFARDLNDKNLFITDIPVTVTGTGNSQSVSAFPGFNPNTGTFAGNGLRSISVQETPTGAPLTADLAKGRGANLHMFGSDLDLQLSDPIALSNKLMYSAGEVDCYCLFNNLRAADLELLPRRPQHRRHYDDNANTAITGPYGLATSGTATLVSTGAAVDPTLLCGLAGFLDRAEADPVLHRRHALHLRSGFRQQADGGRVSGHVFLRRPLVAGQQRARHRPPRTRS